MNTSRFRSRFKRLNLVPQWLLRTVQFVVLSISLAISVTSQAGPVTKNPETVEPLEPWHPGTITTGVKGNDAYIDGHFSITVPVFSTLGADATLSGDLVFLEPYISHGEGGEVATSLGLGWRHLFGSQSINALTRHDGHQAGFMEEGWFAGANVFVDMLDTETDHQFWQLGLGAEIGNRYIELRGNYYIPLSGKQEVDRFRTKESFSSSRTSQSSSLQANDPFASGNTIQQAYTQSVFATTTTSTTTIERLFRRYEEGMEGWDAEVAVLVPGLDKCMDLRLIAGYYSFENQPFGPQAGGTGDIEGWKAGIELRPVPALILSGMWYEDDSLTGGDWTAGVQMQIPFEAGDLGDGKNFWSRIGDSFKPRRRHLAERLAEPVRRQNAAIKLASGTEEDKKARDVLTTVKKVTKLVSQSQHQVVLKDDVIFVNNGGSVGNGIQAGSLVGDGTAERPLVDIQSGGNLAQGNNQLTNRVWNVYTQGTSAGYAENVLSNTASVTFIGSGQLIKGVGGKTFGKGPAPALAGGFLADGIPYFGVHGYHITNGYMGSAGIAAANAQSVTLTDNVIANSANGVALFADGSTVSEARLENNVIQNVTLHGVSGEAQGTARLRAILVGNHIANTTDSGIRMVSAGDAVLDLAASGNVFNQISDDAVTLVSSDNGTLIAGVHGNVMQNIGEVGIFALGDGAAARMSLAANGNAITNVQSGIQLETYQGSAVAPFSAHLTGNSITNASLHGVSLFAEGTHVKELHVTGNVIDTIGTDGVHIETSEGTTYVEITGNLITKTTSDGIFAEVTGTGGIGFLAEGNGIVGNSGDGISVRIEDTAVGLFGVFGNALSQNLGTHVGFTAGNDSSAAFTAKDNTISGGGAGGIVTFILGNATSSIVHEGNVILDQMIGIHVAGNVNTQAAITGNEVARTLAHGLNIEAATVTISGNTVTDSGALGSGSNGIFGRAKAGGTLEISSNTVSYSDGMAVYVMGGDNVISTVKDNIVTVGQAGGIGLHAAHSGITTEFVVTGNTLVDNKEFGIAVTSFLTSAATATISGNTVNSTFGSGIRAEALSTSTLTATLTNNMVNGAGNQGIGLVTHDNATLNATVTGNTVIEAINMSVRTFSSEFSTLTATIENNNFLDTLNNAVYFESLDTSVQNVTSTNNVITGSNFRGLILNGLANSTLNVTWDGNIMTDVARNGLGSILVREATGTTTLNGTVNNIVTPGSSMGLLLDSDGNVSGTVIINGVPVVLPIDLP